jgi:hypothetical protein
MNLKNTLKGMPKKKWRLSLDVDWVPEYPLSDFLRKAEIPNTFFPSKTMVWLDFEKETVTTDWRGGTTIYPVQTQKAA